MWLPMKSDIHLVFLTLGKCDVDLSSKLSKMLMSEILSDSSSLMAPLMDSQKNNDVKLTAADVKAIQRLYGIKTRGSLVTTATSSSNVMLGLGDRLLPRMPDRNNEVETWAVVLLMEYHTTFDCRL